MNINLKLLLKDLQQGPLSWTMLDFLPTCRGAFEKSLNCFGNLWHENQFETDVERFAIKGHGWPSKSSSSPAVHASSYASQTASLVAA